MRVVVCGGDGEHDKNKIFKALDKLNAYAYIDTVVTGSSTGSSYFVHQWAAKNRREAHVILRRSDKVDKITETLHGQDMFKQGQPDFVLLLNDCDKTKILKKIARKLGTPVMEVDV